MIAPLPLLELERQRREAGRDQDDRPLERHRVGDVLAEIALRLARADHLVPHLFDRELLIEIRIALELQTERHAGLEQRPVLAGQQGEHPGLAPFADQRNEDLAGLDELAGPDPQIAHHAGRRGAHLALRQAGLRQLALGAQRDQRALCRKIGRIAQPVDELQLDLALDPLQRGGLLGVVEADQETAGRHLVAARHLHLGHRPRRGGAEVGPSAEAHDRGAGGELADPSQQAEEQPGGEHEDEQAIGPLHPPRVGPQEVPFDPQPLLVKSERLLAEQRGHDRQREPGLDLAREPRPRLLGEPLQQLDVALRKGRPPRRAHRGQHGEHPRRAGGGHRHGGEAIVGAPLRVVRIPVEPRIAPDPFEDHRRPGARHKADQPHGRALPPLVRSPGLPFPERVALRVVQQTPGPLRRHQIGRGRSQRPPRLGRRAGARDGSHRRGNPARRLGLLAGRRSLGDPAAALDPAAQQGDQVRGRNRLGCQIEETVAVDPVLEPGEIRAAGKHQVDPFIRAAKPVGLVEDRQRALPREARPETEHRHREIRENPERLRLRIRRQDKHLPAQQPLAGLDAPGIKAGKQCGGTGIGNDEASGTVVGCSYPTVV